MENGDPFMDRRTDGARDRKRPNLDRNRHYSTEWPASPGCELHYVSGIDGGVQLLAVVQRPRELQKLG